MSGRLAEYNSPVRQGSSYPGLGEYAGIYPFKALVDCNLYSCTNVS